MGVLMMLLTTGGLLAAGVLFAIAWLNESAWLKKFVLGGVAIWLAFYALMLIGASLMSKERLIAIGDKEGKEYCGFYLDCHMHTAVSAVRRVKTIGNKTANGVFYIVTVNVFSNASRATLGLLTVDAHVVDVAQPKLDIREGYGIDHAIESVLIDDEDSIFHARNYFKLYDEAA
jgi:hypothetical protein